MYSQMDMKDIIKKVYDASDIMTRPCYLSARGKVRNIDVEQIGHCSLVMFKKGKTNIFVHSL